MSLLQSARIRTALPPSFSDASSRSSSRSSTRARAPPLRYQHAPSLSPAQRAFATLNTAHNDATALAVADDVLAPAFNDPRARLRVRTVGTRSRLERYELGMVTRRFRAACKEGMGGTRWEARDLARQMQALGLVKGEEEMRAFENLCLRYAHLKQSARVKLTAVTMGGRVEAGVVATAFIRKGTLVLELGGLMSADAIEVVAASHGHPKHRTQPPFEQFSVVWRGPGQCGPGSRADRLLLGPGRFLNHSCVPNSKLRPFPGTNAWGLETMRDVLPGEEVTIYYGRKYFAPGECACVMCQPRC